MSEPYTLQSEGWTREGDVLRRAIRAWHRGDRPRENGAPAWDDALRALFALDDALAAERSSEAASTASESVSEGG